VAILLTDGQNNAGAIDPLQAARIAEALGMRVYTIGLIESGSRRSGSVNVDEKPQEMATSLAPLLRGRERKTLDRYL
jgi:hypothetical protein